MSRQFETEMENLFRRLDLAGALKDGKVNILGAFRLFRRWVNEMLPVFEEFLGELTGLVMDRGFELEGLKKQVNELTRELQEIQQQSLLKEERFDEKCRELERYKVISELFTRATATGDVSEMVKFSENERNNNNVSIDDINNNNTATNRNRSNAAVNNNNVGNSTDGLTARISNSNSMNFAVNTKNNNVANQAQPTVKKRVSQQGSSSCEVGSSAPRKRTTDFPGVSHSDRAQMHVSDYVNPFGASIASAQPPPPPPSGNSFDRNSYGTESNSFNYLASAYAGGPCRRRPPESSIIEPQERDIKVRNQFQNIGGINLSSVPRISIENTPVIDYGLHIPVEDLYAYDRGRGIKISLTGQSNKVTSSSRNAAAQMRQIANERSLHQQVAHGGPVSRLTSRRKKVYPFF